MKVIDWISYEEANKGLESGKYKESIGGVGGWFGYDKQRQPSLLSRFLKGIGFDKRYEEETKWVPSGARWKDYIQDMRVEFIPYYEALRQEMLDRNMVMTGEQHQQSDGGVPVFEDNTVGMFSYRAWGDFMAAVMSEKENKNYGYMDFYM